MMVTAFARSFDLPAVILRPLIHTALGSERGTTIIRQAIDPECKSIRVGNLTPIRDFNYVHDIALRSFRPAQRMNWSLHSLQCWFRCRRWLAKPRR